MQRITIILVSLLVSSTLIQGQTKKEESNRAINLGIKEYNNGNIEDAIAIFTKAIRLDPENPLAYYNRGLSKKSLQDPDGALVDLNKAIKLGPNNPDPYNIRGLVYMAMRKYKIALDDFSKCISLMEIAEKTTFSPYFNRGLLYYNDKKYELAIESFTSGINLNQEHEQSYQNRGLCYLKLNKFDEAIVDFSQATYMNTKNPQHYMNRGSAKTSRGSVRMEAGDQEGANMDFESAIKDFNKAIDLEPKSHIAYFNLGVCYNNMNDLRMACNSWNKSYELGNKGAKTALEDANCVDPKEDGNQSIGGSSLVYNGGSDLEIKREVNEETIKKYLSESRNLDPIEGIWSANHTTVIDNASKKEMTNYARVAIIKDTTKGAMRDFIMIMLEGKKFIPYSIIAEFSYTAYPRVYLSSHFDRDGSKESWNFTIDNLGLLSANKNLVEGRSQVYEELYYVKIFPRAKHSEGNGGSGKAKDPNTVSSTGTGFALTTGGIFATNAHVIKDAERFTITITEDDKKKTYNGKVLHKDPINDVALVAIDDEKFSKLGSIPYNINETHSIGEKVFTIGFPLSSAMGESFKLADGIISALSGYQDDIRFLQVTVPLQPGNSGGPLFNQDGDVIGITSARLSSEAMGTDVQNVNYSLKITYLTNLIKMVPNFENSFSETNLKGMPLKDQVNVLKGSICLIKSY